MTEPVTAEETRPHDIPWYAIAEWSLRRKLALALAIPVLLAATFGGLRVLKAADDARTFSRLESRVAVLQPAVRMVDSASAVAIAGRGSDTGAVERSRTAFDAAAAELRRVMRSSDLSEEQVVQLDQALASALTLRNTEGSAPVDTVSEQFAATATPVTVVLNELTGETSDTRLSTVGDILAGQVALTKQRLLTAASFEGTGVPDAPIPGSDPNVKTTVDPVALGNAIGEEATAIAALASNLGANDTFVSALAQGNELRLDAAPAIAAGDAGLPRAQDAVGVYTTLAKQVNDQVVASMRAKASDGRGDAIRDSVATILLLLAAVGLALAVARMLLEPITRVRVGALDVANERLPTALRQIRAGEEPAAVEPLPVHTSEEVGQLARAVDVLHTQAIHLATEQARLREQVSAMFETLSRRSTSLINQQLGLIENLERDEDDPRRLESLFRLDHLAARIRRNGESLLVLAGAAPRSGAGQDLPLGDVLRAAVSEVQDYQRVRLSVSDLTIQAGAAPNLIHLFAELIDNALSYSPPDSEVTVASVRGVDGGTLVEVSDEGLGMTPEAVEAANESLVTGGEVTTETARRMGLYVVGQLAIRHDVTVRIRPNPESTGTIVSVFLPAALLSSGRGPAADLEDEDDAGETPVATPVEATRPRIANLTAVPNLPSDDAHGVPSPVGPTTLPNMRVLRPAPTEEPPSTPSGLPRRQPGAARGPVPTPGRPAWASAPPAPAEPEPPTDRPAEIPAEATPERDELREPTASRDFHSIRDLPPTSVGETPIFRQLQSSWLSDNDTVDLPWATDEIDQGWQAAERAATAEPAGRSRSGLPMRRPGSTLVPGQAGAGGSGTVARDPEAIRQHLNRHLAGVRRGRAGGSAGGTGSGAGAGTGSNGTNESRSSTPDRPCLMRRWTDHE